MLSIFLIYSTHTQTHTHTRPHTAYTRMASRASTALQACINALSVPHFAAMLLHCLARIWLAQAYAEVTAFISYFRSREAPPHRLLLLEQYCAKYVRNEQRQERISVWKWTLARQNSNLLTFVSHGQRHTLAAVLAQVSVWSPTLCPGC